jgi:hypothetical protein
MELADKINNSNLDIFATTPIQKRNGDWIAFVYYNVAKEGKQTSQKGNHFSTHKKNRSKSAFKPTREQLEQWADEDVTDGQRKVLEKMDISGVEIDNMSKLDAYHIIKNTQKENI